VRSCAARFPLLSRPKPVSPVSGVEEEVQPLHNQNAAGMLRYGLSFCGSLETAQDAVSLTFCGTVDRPPDPYS
jgi:hypothetical protein